MLPPLSLFLAHSLNVCEFHYEPVLLELVSLCVCLYPSLSLSLLLSLSLPLSLNLSLFLSLSLN